MVRFHLSPIDLSRTRFAYSPLWETVTSYGLLLWPDKASKSAIHLPWIREARESTQDLDLELLKVLLEPGGYIPDFVSPPPDTPLPELETELGRVLSTDPDLVRAEVMRSWRNADHLPDAVQTYLKHPGEALERLTDVLHRYWERTLQAHWPRLRSLLEQDILVRARAQALGGAEALFGDLHPMVRYRNRALELEKSFCTLEAIKVGSDHQAASVHLNGQGLLLVPSAFVWPKFSYVSDPNWQPMLAYAPRGVANLWASKPPPVGVALERLIGRGRASVLLSLDPPSTTLEVARRLELAPSGVSQHLTHLREAGLIEGFRLGRNVYYNLSDTGHALVRLFGEPGDASDDDLATMFGQAIESVPDRT